MQVMLNVVVNKSHNYGPGQRWGSDGVVEVKTGRTLHNILTETPKTNSAQYNEVKNKDVHYNIIRNKLSRVEWSEVELNTKLTQNS